MLAYFITTELLFCLWEQAMCACSDTSFRVGHARLLSFGTNIYGAGYVRLLFYTLLEAGHVRLLSQNYSLCEQAMCACSESSFRVGNARLLSFGTNFMKQAMHACLVYGSRPCALAHV